MLYAECVSERRELVWTDEAQGPLGPMTYQLRLDIPRRLQRQRVWLGADRWRREPSPDIPQEERVGTGSLTSLREEGV